MFVLFSLASVLYACVYMCLCIHIYIYFKKRYTYVMLKNGITSHYSSYYIIQACMILFQHGYKYNIICIKDK